MEDNRFEEQSPEQENQTEEEQHTTEAGEGTPSQSQEQVPQQESSSGPASYTQAVNTIRELKGIIENAPKAFLRAGEINLSRKEMAERIELLQMVMPNAVEEADRVIRRRDQILSDAKAQADAMIAAAKKSAEDIGKQAETARVAVEHQIDAAKGNLQRIQAEGAALQKQM